MRVKVYVHPTCPASVKLMLKIKDEGLSAEVELIDISKRPYAAFEKGILSVPAVEISGNIIVQGVVHDRAIEFIRRGRAETLKYADVQELIDRFTAGILESFAVTAWAYVNWSLTPILENRQFVSSVIGVYGNDYHTIAPRLKLQVEERENELLRNMSDSMIRSIAYNAVREMYWMNTHPTTSRELEKRVSEATFTHWIQVRGCIGRVGLNLRPATGSLHNRIRKAYRYLVEKYEEILPRIIREQEKVRTMLEEYGWKPE